MRPAPLIVSGGLLLLACSCYGPGYQPYGYPAYPGTVQPGTPYPGGTGGPTLGQPTINSSQAPIPDNGGNAPRYDGASSNSEQRPVPNYTDPNGNGSQYFPSGGSGASNNSATAPEVSPLSFDEPATSPRTVNPATQPTQGEPSPFFGGNDEDFRPPVQQGELH
jgi:hypothetical protein